MRIWREARILVLLLFLCLFLPAVADTSLVDRMFNYTSTNGLDVGHFSCNQYARFTISTFRRNDALRTLPGSMKLKKGFRKYFGEAELSMNYSQPNIYDTQNVAFYCSWSGAREAIRRAFPNLNISLYEPNLLRDHILSPANRRNKMYYRYKADSSFYDVDSRKVVRLKVEPKIYNTQLVKGFMLVDSLTGVVRSFHFDIYFDLVSVTLDAKMGRSGLFTLMPERVDAHVLIKFLGNIVDTRVENIIKFSEIGNSQTSVKNIYKSSSLSHQDLTYLNQQRVSSSNLITDPTYFELHRPYPLSLEQISIVNAQKRGQLLADYGGQKKIKKQNIFESLEDILIDKHNIQDAWGGTLRLPPIITPSMMQWSESKGISLRTRVKYHHTSPKEKTFDIKPGIGYTFKQDLLLWNVPVDFVFAPRRNGAISFDIGNGNRTYSSEQAEDVRSKLSGVARFDSLSKVIQDMEFNYYNDFYCRSSISISPYFGLMLTAGLTYHRRSLTNWNQTASEVGLTRVYHSFAPRFHLVWTPNSYYYRDGRKKIFLYSKYPTFSIDYERGVRVAKYKNEYERWEADVAKTFKLKALRSLYLRFGFGFYTNQKDVYFVDFDNFTYRSLPEQWDDDFSGQFHLLDRRWYNESDYYVRFSSTYSSPMLLLSRIKYLTRFVKQERIYFNALTVHGLNPYVECGYGMATKLFDVAMFMATSNRGGFEIGGKIDIRLFDR